MNVKMLLISALHAFSRYLFAYLVTVASVTSTEKVRIDILRRHTYMSTTLIFDNCTAFTSDCQRLVDEKEIIPEFQVNCAMTMYPQTIGKLGRTQASLKTTFKMAFGE